MSTETPPVKPSRLRQLSGVVSLGILFALSYWVMGYIMVTPYTPNDYLLRVVFSALPLGVPVLFYKWVIVRHAEPAVMLWGAYAGVWLLMLLQGQYGNNYVTVLLLMLFIGCSFVVFLIATFLLSADIRDRRFQGTTLLANLVILFASGQVLVEIMFNPIVI
ncbi:hypothetical protein [Gimesia sp.]|uniref:hypothetical protein n=1 Tax=Gimesia sp. TaxID=2024833 RepID=UPI0032EDCB55